MSIRDTQRNAWDDIQEKLPESRRRVLSIIQQYGDFGITTFMIARALNWPINCVSGRVTELTQAGVIRDSCRRAENPSGKKAVLWIAANDN